MAKPTQKSSSPGFRQPASSRKNGIITALLISVNIFFLTGQQRTDQVFIDDIGVIRWVSDNSEVHGFGVNYTLPFAHEYRMARKENADPEEAIRQDVYHMARLGLDLYRVHVWDTEISDSLGNLLDNEHLRLFDYAVGEMKKRGMRFIITPIAYWGNGWPEQDEPTPGFSYKYGKANCLTDSRAKEAQASYLFQFLNHVNRYTGTTYGQEPSVIAFEISNEPHHDQPEEEVTGFINTMVDAMRSTGCIKPIFYNMSHSIHLYRAYLKANVQGGTFQWYPTGLVAGHMIKGNFLPHVASYDIPFADDPMFRRMAKIVYEFDPADVAGTIMYPAMANSFRKAGFQLATQFAYDAMFYAPYNTNYGTHFMNLAYTPGKAISLRIASAVFHNTEMYGRKTDESSFHPLKISYTDDLAQWISEEQFFYTNSTFDRPPLLSGLKEIAGCGSSPLVKYTGTGAYFLDRLADGVWRLEVMPDAYWIEDPYSTVGPGRQKAAVIHREREMTIILPDLNGDFIVEPVNEGNDYQPVTADGKMDVIPGVYILTRKGVRNRITAEYQYGNIKVGEYVAPPTDIKKTVINNHSPSEVIEGKPFAISFTAVSGSPCIKAEVVFSAGSRWRTVEAVNRGPDSFQASVPGEFLQAGFLDYRIIIYTAADTTRFPGGITGDPWRWDNRDDSFFTIKKMPEDSHLILWEAGSDWVSTFSIWDRSVNLSPDIDGETSLSLRLRNFPAPDPVDQDDKLYAFKSFFGDRIAGRRDELTGKTLMVMQYENLLTSSQPVEIGLADRNGTVFASDTLAIPGKGFLMIPVSSLKRVPYIILPRPFPLFLPLRAETSDMPFDLPSAESLQVVIRPGEAGETDLRIRRIWLE